ncbi:hypothetical protein [Acinetobacter sp.]|uniref:hypothetical protein n=1 Tax=Acinetobacter sp. TaxID=472 RepID=UPI00258892D8|nr:hypothetical protein [Acinetobacter sp.]
MSFYLLQRKLYTFILFLLLFVYSFFLKIKYFPYFVILPLSLIGCMVFLERIHKGKIKKDFFNFFLILIAMTILYMISYLINLNGEFYFLKEIVLLSLTYFLSAFSIKFFFELFDVEYNFEILTKLLAFVVSFQLLISLVGYIQPAIFNFIFSIIDIGLEESTIGDFNAGRMVGVGASFFGSGIINSFMLIIIMYYINNMENNEGRFKLIFYFIFIAIVGMVSSRTTIIGLILSIPFLFTKLANLKFFIYLFFIFLLGWTVFSFVKLDNRISDLMNFGFGFLYDYNNSQASGSLSTLQEMYEVYPDNFKTWILGDALYKNEFGGYYKNTDVGYLRIIFASGIVGLIAYICMHVYLIHRAFVGRWLLICITTILFFVLNFKGVANLYAFLFLYLLIPNRKLN